LSATHDSAAKGCEERRRLLREFEEAAAAFSQVIPEFRARELFDPTELESAMSHAIERVDQACGALERHDKEHRCR
jgi:hypothetical protein